MRRTIITNLQWWLIVGLFVVSGVLYPDISRGHWWWSLLFSVAFYAAFMAVLRLRFETPQQARERRSGRTKPTVIFRSDAPVGTEKAPAGSRWIVTSGGSVRSVWVQSGTHAKPRWSPEAD